MTQSDLQRKTTTFNSSVELGTRISLILTSLSDQALDLDELVFFDYALLYSQEFDGPENLHPPLPNHLAEVVHRREYLPNALRLFISRGLLSVKATNNGVYYKATDNTAQFVRCLRSDYFSRMWTNLFWIEDNYQKLCAQRFTFLSGLGNINDNKNN